MLSLYIWYVDSVMRYISVNRPYSIGKVGGIRSLIAGGEGLVMKFRGNGHVWVQSRNLASLADKLLPFLPKTGGN